MRDRVGDSTFQLPLFKTGLVPCAASIVPCIGTLGSAICEDNDGVGMCGGKRGRYSLSFVICAGIEGAGSDKVVATVAVNVTNDRVCSGAKYRAGKCCLK